MMRETIKRVLREQAITTGNNSLNNGSRIVPRNLSNGEKQMIKSNGEKIFGEFKLMDINELNDLFKESGLFYGSPDKEFLERNIKDISFAVSKIDLYTKSRETLMEKKDLMVLQLNSIIEFESGKRKNISRHIEFFHEIPNEEDKKMVWSIVNMFDNNYLLWINFINKYLDEIGFNRQINSNPTLINHYFNLTDSNGDKKASKDLIDAMINRAHYQKIIFNKTWGGGQKVEQEFISKLKSIGFSDDQIYVFSGEKNAVDGVGIDLAVKCEYRWVPIQVKSSEGEASHHIPYKGFSCFPYGNTYKLISKLKGNNDQRKITELCEPINEPISN
jgi:hypothetical protein